MFSFRFMTEWLDSIETLLNDTPVFLSFQPLFLNYAPNYAPLFLNYIPLVQKALCGVPRQHGDLAGRRS